MGKITYLNKDKLSLDDAIRKFRDIDANEIKAVVNGLDDLIIALTAQVTVNNGKVSYTDAAAVAQLVSDMATVQGLLVSDDTSLDSIQEIVDALKAAQVTLAQIDEDSEIIALIDAFTGSDRWRTFAFTAADKIRFAGVGGAATETDITAKGRELIAAIDNAGVRAILNYLINGTNTISSGSLQFLCDIGADIAIGDVNYHSGIGFYCLPEAKAWFNLSTQGSEGIVDIFFDGENSQGYGSGIIVFDDRVVKKGIQNAASGYVTTPLSLTTKEWVEALFSGGFGLEFSGGKAKIGGTLSEGRITYYSDGVTAALFLDEIHGGVLLKSKVFNTNKQMQIDVTADSGNERALIGWKNGGEVTQFKVDGASGGDLLIFDTRSTPKGIVGNADFSANATSLSYVQRIWVEAITGSALLPSLNTVVKTSLAAAINEVLAIAESAGGGGGTPLGYYDLDASSGSLPTTGSGDASAIRLGDRWLITVAGTLDDGVDTVEVEVNDVLTAKVAAAADLGDFVISQGNTELASQSEAEAATNNVKTMPPLRVRQQFRSLISDALLTILQGTQESFTTALKNVIDNQSGVNTGDQDISGISTNASAIALRQLILAEGAFVDGDKTKLDGIESGATADQTGAEILAAFESETGRDVSVDGTKLDAIPESEEKTLATTSVDMTAENGNILSRTVSGSENITITNPIPNGVFTIIATGGTALTINSQALVGDAYSPDDTNVIDVRCWRTFPWGEYEIINAVYS